MTDRKRNPKLWWWVGAATIICGLSVRGNYLLGTFIGVTFAMIAFAIAVIGYRNLLALTPSRLGVVLYALFAIGCAVIMFTPATFSPAVQHFIDKQAADRDARQKIAALVQSNPDYYDIKIQAEHRKIMFVSISGNVPNRAAVDRLVADLSRFNFTRRCSLHGRVTIRDTGEVHEFTDDDLSHDSDTTTGNHEIHGRWRVAVG